MLSLIINLLKALNSENSNRQIALAFCLGFIVGVTPILSVHNAVIFMFVLLLRVHLASFILAVGVFSGIGLLLQGTSINIGELLLTHSSLHNIFSTLYQFTWFKLAHFHHTFTLGSLVLSCLLAIPLYFIFLVLIQKYRDYFMAYIENLRIVKALKASKFYQLYCDLSGKG